MPGRTLVILVALTLALMLWTQVGAQSGVSTEILGEAAFNSLPASPVNVRVSEGLFPSGTPAIVHAHGAGWVYVVEGAHILTMGGRTETFQPGQAAWTPAGVTHTHDWDRTKTHRFWFIGTATNQPPTVPSGFRLFRLTEALEGLQSGAYGVRLNRLTLQPEAVATLTRVVAPAVVIGLRGSLSLLTATGSVLLNAEQVVLFQPGSAYQVRNLSGQPGALLVQSLIARE